MSTTPETPAHGAGEDDAARRRERAEREFAESSTTQPPGHDAAPAPDDSGSIADTKPAESDSQ